MKYLFILITLAVSSMSLAQESSYIAISPTFAMKLPFKISSKADLPSLHSKLIKLDEGLAKNSEILIVHNRPLTLANKFSMDRYWKDSRRQTFSLDSNERNLGCKKMTSRTYRCSRDVGQNSKFISEAIFWNSKSDLVLIRVSSLSSAAHARQILNKIKVESSPRLPAGASK